MDPNRPLQGSFWSSAASQAEGLGVARECEHIVLSRYNAAQYEGNTLQRTCVDKIPAIRFWGGVGGANIKNLDDPTRPPDTTYYGVLMYCIVLTGPTGDHDSLRRGAPTSRRGGQAALHLGVSRLKKHTNAAGTRPPGFLCQEAQVTAQGT